MLHRSDFFLEHLAKALYTIQSVMYILRNNLATQSLSSLDLTNIERLTVKYFWSTKRIVPQLGLAIQFNTAPYIFKRLVNLVYKSKDPCG